MIYVVGGGGRGVTFSRRRKEINIATPLCVCVCVCVCARARFVEGRGHLTPLPLRVMSEGLCMHGIRDCAGPDLVCTLWRIKISPWLGDRLCLACHIVRLSPVIPSHQSEN